VVSHDPLNGLDELRGEREQVPQVVLAQRHKRSEVLIDLQLRREAGDCRIVVVAVHGILAKLGLLKNSTHKQKTNTPHILAGLEDLKNLVIFFFYIYPQHTCQNRSACTYKDE